MCLVGIGLIWLWLVEGWLGLEEAQSRILLIFVYILIDFDEIANLGEDVHLPDVDERLVVEDYLIGVLSCLLVNDAAVDFVVSGCVDLDPSYLFIEIDILMEYLGVLHCLGVVELHEIF